MQEKINISQNDNSGKHRIVCFDFDGTLTTKDSMLSIIVFQRGWMGLAWALLRQLHLIVLMFLKVYSNQKTKERLLTHCFGGMKVEEFESLCRDFATSHRHILRSETMNRLCEAKESGAEVFVITASPVRWVSRFVEGVTVLGSEMEVREGRITGKLLNRNCYGEEKVRRLLNAMPDLKEHRDNYYISAYGDSRGDRELLAYADEAWLIRKSKSQRV